MTIHHETITYKPCIDAAVQTRDVHLNIGRAAFCLHYGAGACVSAYAHEQVKSQSIAADLPVIDSLAVPFDAVVELAVRGSMIAVGLDPAPQPWHAFALTPRNVVACTYAAAGAEIWNLPLVRPAGRASR